MQYLDAQQLGGTAGVAGGMALVGRPSQGAAFAAFGFAVELAEVAQRMAETHGLKVCAVDTNSYDDLAARLNIATVDVVATAHAPDGRARLIAVMSERDSTNGEWLYSVGAANGGLSANEQVWQQVLQRNALNHEAMAMIASELKEGVASMWYAVLKLSLANLDAHAGAPEKNSPLIEPA